MTTNAMSGHGTLIKRNGNTIAELGDITPPAVMRNTFDSTTQQEDIDSFVSGVLRRSESQLKINFISSDASHDENTGLYSAIITKQTDRYEFVLPDGFTILCSGQVVNIVPHAPVDGLLSADVTFKFSGKMYVGDVLVG